MGKCLVNRELMCTFVGNFPQRARQVAAFITERALARRC